MPQKQNICPKHKMSNGVRKILFFVLFLIIMAVVGLQSTHTQAEPFIYNGESCSYDEQCYSGNCYNNICCRPTAICCERDSQCPDNAYCGSEVPYCLIKLDAGSLCDRDRQCQSGSCTGGRCAAESYCGDGTCDSDETCTSCSSDCGSCRYTGEACSYSWQCAFGLKCEHGICCDASYDCCTSDSHCASDWFCWDGSYVCSRQLDDGSSCNRARQCEGGYCLHGKCRSSSTYCGDDYCDSGETCSNCADDCGVCDLRSDGSSCTNSSQCQSQHCDNGYCCQSGMCCHMDNDCPSYAFCNLSTYVCQYQRYDGEDCSRARQCRGGYCLHSNCRSSSTYCGDDYCDSGETCQNCSSDCGSCPPGGQPGASCNQDDDCDSGNCSNNLCCQSGAICCQDDSDCRSSDSYCSGSPHYVCALKWDDGTSCSQARKCKGGYCVHGQCRSSSTYCGDGKCDQPEDCLSCLQDCGTCSVPPPLPPEIKFPDLKPVLSPKSMELKEETSQTLTLSLENHGEGIAENVSFKILVDHPEFVEVVPQEKIVGDVTGSDLESEEIRITAKEPGVAHLALHIRGDNSASLMRFVRVEVTAGIAMSVPESIFLLAGEVNEFAIFIINPGNELVKVQDLTMESSNQSVVTIEQGSVLEVRGQGQGIKPDEVFDTKSQDALRGVFPPPKIRAINQGETELLFKLRYYFPGTNRGLQILEKRTRVKVGQLRGGQTAMLDFQIIPAGLLIERDEAREVKLVLANRGSQTIRQGKIIITKSEGAPFDATYQVSFGFMEPNQEAVAKIEIIGHPQLSAELEEQAKHGNLAVGGSLTFKGEYEAASGHKFEFEDEMKITLVDERGQCDPGDEQCVQAVACLLELSNFTSCALEFADIFSYLDKPVAVVLATSDACELGKRASGGDSIGAAITAIFMAVDISDNLGEAVPGPGNIASAFVDVIEGSADCIEGYVYDAVDEYCAGPREKGYTGCAKNLFDLFANQSGKYKEAKSARKYVVAVGGSPVSFTVVDNDGNALGPTDGVLLFQGGDLKLVFIKNPQNLTNGFNFEINGLADGEYNLVLGLIDEGQVVETRELQDQPIRQDEKLTLSLAVKAQLTELTGLLVGEKEIAQARKKPISLNWRALKTILYIILPVLVLFLIGRIIWRRLKAKKRAVKK